MAISPRITIGPAVQMPKKEMKEPGDQEQKSIVVEAKKSIWSTILYVLSIALLVAGIAVAWFYLAAFITGNEGVGGPLKLLTNNNYGQYSILFTGMIALILFVGVKMKVISWNMARITLIIAAVFVAIYIIAVSIWPDFSPRAKLAAIHLEIPESPYSISFFLSAHGTQGTRTFKKARDLNINISGNAPAKKEIVKLNIPGVITSKLPVGDYPYTIKPGEKLIFLGMGVADVKISITEVQ